jgi:hypothetical protein
MSSLKYHLLSGVPLILPAAQAAGPSAAGIGANRARFADDPNETVEAQRRRRGAPGGPSGRAEMPGRPSSSGRGGSPLPPSGGGGWPTRGGGQRSGGLKLPIWLILLLLAIFFLVDLFSGGDNPPADTTTPQNIPQETAPSIQNTAVIVPTLANTAVTTPVKTLTTSANKGAAQSWTVMLYLDADDPVLEQDIFMDLNEAEQVGSNAQVNLVAQIDRYAGGYQGDGDWTSTRRYFLTKDNDLFHLHSKVVADLGEISMADPKTLVDFATWAIQAYPADKFVLILSDHGMGWPGGWTDPRPTTLRGGNQPLAQVIKGNMLYTSEIDVALGQIRAQTGLDRFELVGMDACLMSQLEVYSALAPHARYLVTSQETEPALGWAYTSFLKALEDNPGLDGGGLGSQIVSSFIRKDQRIVDSQARIDFLREGSPLGGTFGRAADMDPAQLSAQIEKSITLTAAKMDALPGLTNSLNQLAFALQKEDPSVVSRAKTYAQSFTSIFGKDVPPSYIDLGSFVQLLQQQSSSSALRAAAGAVLAQIKQVVVAERHGPEKSGSTGIAIYFPNSQLYQNAIAGARTYTTVASRFAKDSLWDDFLAFYYTSSSFKIDSGSAVVPGANTRVISPGLGTLEVSPLRLSLSSANYNQPVTFQADIKGRNIGYVYLFVGYYDPASQSILVADKDYLESPTTRQVGDLYYPDWSDNQSFTLKYTWTPSVFAINDGKQSAVALLNPERYGATAEDAVYSADGIYTNTATGETCYARMFFSSGRMTHLYGFTGLQPVGPLREIIPQSGDQITLIETWLEPDGSGGYRSVTENGTSLTFGSQAFTWKEMFAAAGDYMVGYVISDLDGNEKQVFGKITIK